MEKPDFYVRVKDMIDLVGDPFVEPAWEGEYPFSRDIVQQCIDEGDLDDRAWDDLNGGNGIQQSDKDDPMFHARRVAYMVQYPDPNPIRIDVGVPGMCYPKYLIFDGCHRFAAAVYKGEVEVPVCYSGSTKLFKEMFPTRSKRKGTIK